MGQFQSQNSAPSAACGFPACAVADGAAEFCFSFPPPSLGKPHKLLRSSRVQPWAMIRPFHHPGPDQLEGRTASSHRCGHPCQEGRHWGTSVESSLPVEATPPNPGAPPRWKMVREPGTELGRGGLSENQEPQCLGFSSPRGHGQVLRFPFPPFSHTLTLDREFNDRVVERCDNNWKSFKR